MLVKEPNGNCFMGWDLPDLSLGFDLRILPRARKKHSALSKNGPLGQVWNRVGNIALSLSEKRIPVTRTLKGNEKQSGIAGNSSYRGKLQWNLDQGNLVRVSGEFELSEFELSSIYCSSIRLIIELRKQWTPENFQECLLRSDQSQ